MNLVNIIVSVLNPPKPSKLQQTGAIVSVGGTTLAAGQTQLLTSSTDLANILSSAQTIDTLSWAQGVATVTTADDLNIAEGSSLSFTISGAAPAAYNGTFTGTVVGANVVAVPMSQDPGTATTVGSIALANVDDLKAANTSFWAQGKQRSIYVLELGRVDTATAIEALRTFIQNDTALGATYRQFYAYLTPAEFSPQVDFRTLASEYTANDSMLYFFALTDLTGWAALSATKYKNLYIGINSPDMADTHNDVAAQFQSFLSNAPSATNKVPPMGSRYMFGTTTYPIRDNSTLLTQLQAANVNYIGSGAEGGISNMLIAGGRMADGQPAGYWYAIDWAIINLQLDLANEIILGSNSAINPLYYDQDGIDRLQKRALQTLRRGISYGLLLGSVISEQLTQNEFNEKYNNGDFNGQATVNAVPFTDWVANDPSEYEAGYYGGLSGVITPRRGFDSITFNLNVSNFAG